MSFSKKFYDMQDFILSRTALEKVKRHVEERKENSVYKWISSELNYFLNKYENEEDLKQCIGKIKDGLSKENYNDVLQGSKECIEILSKKINELYESLMEQGQ
ncbi:hypothetical protein [Acidianus sp. HS-5]|uniref:hypothetical protein n=1 Tax=Acidianus sp. HS-5 TaxID=2886040 RepID=UPI001F306264|nr:hypothetical protein [Acidianus sp. HS-5]